MTEKCRDRHRRRGSAEGETTRKGHEEKLRERTERRRKSDKGGGVCVSH